MYVSRVLTAQAVQAHHIPGRLRLGANTIGVLCSFQAVL